MTQERRAGILYEMPRCDVFNPCFFREISSSKIYGKLRHIAYEIFLFLRRKIGRICAFALSNIHNSRINHTDPEALFPRKLRILLEVSKNLLSYSFLTKNPFSSYLRGSIVVPCYLLQRCKKEERAFEGIPEKENNTKKRSLSIPLFPSPFCFPSLPLRPHAW